MGYFGEALKDNPLRLYKMNETSGTAITDYGSQAQGGTLHGGVTLNQTSIIPSDSTDGSANFNGTTGYIQAATTSLPTGSASWSLGGWVKMSSVPGTGIHIMAEWGTNSSNNAAAIGLFSGVFRVNTYSANNITGPTAVSNTAYYLLGTYDGTNLRFYANGVLQGSPLACTPAISLTYCYIGTEDNAADDFWSGNIQGVGIYNTALSATRALAHYTAGILPFSAVLSGGSLSSGIVGGVPGL